MKVCVLNEDEAWFVEREGKMPDCRFHWHWTPTKATGEFIAKRVRIGAVPNTAVLLPAKGKYSAHVKDYWRQRVSDGYRVWQFYGRKEARRGIMKKRATKAASVDVLGNLPDDAIRVRQCLKELGKSQTWLAQEANLSLIMVNSFLNGRKKLSPSASERVARVINAGFDQKNAADRPRLSAEQAARLRQQANRTLNEPLDEVEHQYYAFLDLRSAVDPDGVLTVQEALVALGGPPLHPVAYEAWKAKQIEVHTAAKELPLAKAWIKRLEGQRSDLQKQISLLEQINSKNDEVVSLYQGLAERLKKQLLDAGITPVE
jgi:hypothetical protein